MIAYISACSQLIRKLFKVIEFIFHMQQTLTLQNLLSCLGEKDHYKGTQIYLNEVLRYNEQAYGVIDEALQQTLLETKVQPMTKLLSLRFFKELLITANFSLIDCIDERIEEQIIQVAQYNKKSKEVNRGANYFSETLKIKNDPQIQKISSSFILLALQIVMMLGKWYKVDQDGQQTRFAQYLNELIANGVTFPPENQLNFFKKDDEDKFRKNYKKFAQFFIQASLKNKPQKDQSVNKLQSKPQEQKNVTFTSLPDQQLLQKSKNIQKKEQQLSSSLNETLPAKIINSEVTELKNQIQENDDIINKLKIDLSKQENRTILLESELKDQKILLAQAQQQLTKLKALQTTQAEECYKILISPPKNTDDLIQEIDLLQDLMQQTTEGFEKERHNMSTELNQLRIQNQQFKKTIEIHKKQIEKLQQQKHEDKLMEEQRLIEQRVLRQSLGQSFDVIDEPKFGTKQREQKQLLIIKEQILTSRKEVFKDYSNANDKLKEKLSQVCQNKFETSSSKQSRQGSRSLKKTESQLRLKTNQTSMTAANFRKTNNNQSKLMKTAQSSFKQRDQKSKMVTIFPYLQTYFPDLPVQCHNFKQHCLTQLNEPFFENQLLKVGLAKPIENQNYFIYVYNKTSSEQKIKVLPSHSSLSIEGQKVKKIPALTAGQYELKLGAPNLNMRCPTLTVTIGNHGISLTSSTNEKILTFPIPITLLDFFKIKKSPNKYQNTQNSLKTIKFSSNRFAMSSNIPEISQFFPKLTSQLRMGETVRMGEIECQNLPLKLQISQWGREVSFAIEFYDKCQFSNALSKVFLQVLMWLLRD